MKTEEMFEGFNPEEQARHEQYLIERCGEGMRKSIADSKEKVKHWTKADWQKSGAAFDRICQGLVSALERKLPVDSPDVQGVVRCHYEWLKQFWTPTRASYIGHTQLIVDSDLRKAYEAHHPQLPEFVASAIKVYAERELA